MGLWLEINRDSEHGGWLVVSLQVIFAFLISWWVLFLNIEMGFSGFFNYDGQIDVDFLYFM